MAEFHQCVTTKQGLNLIALSRVNKCPLVFTKMAIGDSRPTDTSTISAMTALVDEKLTSDITSLKKIKNTDTTEGRYAAFGKFSNSTLQAGFHISEVGLWAKVESSYYTGDSWDGYTGDAVLFCYGYADEGKTDWLPSKDTPMTPQEVGIYTSVGDAETVSVHVSDTQTVGEAEFQAHLTDVNAHSDFKGCTSTANGQRGFVPKPGKGDGEKFLSAKGGWEKAKMTPLELVNILYPKGIILPFADGTDPNEIWQGTTWKRTLQGRVPIGAGEYWENGKKFSYSVGDTGGEAEHQLTEREMAKITPRIASATLSVSRVAQIHGVVTNYSSTNQYKDVPRDGWSGTVISGEETGGGAKDHGMEVRNVLETLSPSISVAPIGGNEKHENRPPFQGVCYWVRTQ